VQTCDQDVPAGPLASHPSRMARVSGPVTRRAEVRPVAQVTPESGTGRQAAACVTLGDVSVLLVSRLHVDLQRTSSAVCSPAR
jgi:hypothetical protein